MNREQKRAWALVISMSLAGILAIAALVAHHWKTGWARPFVFAAAGVIGIGVLILFRFKPDKGAVASDERDELIKKNANLAGFGAVYLYVILMSFLPIGILGEKGSIPVTWCPALLVGAGFCQAFAISVAILVQYGRGDRDGK